MTDTAVSVTHRPHGSYVKYVQDRCRCEPCKTANRDYERARTSRIEPPYISAVTARNHITELQAAGVGLQSIAKASGVSTGALSKLMFGDYKGRGPSKRIRRSTHNAIMDVTPAAARGTAKIDAAPTRRLLDEMIAAGIPKARIAEELGARSQGLQIGERPLVAAMTANAVAALHARWLSGQWSPVRHDRHGNTYQPAPPPPAERGRADVSELYFELADIIDERRAQADWRQSAACRGRPGWMWFPERGDHETLEAARRICLACMVRDQCRAANLDKPVGVFGALSANARRQLRADEVTPVERTAARCGSNAGYHRHRHHGEEACDSCLIAHRHDVQDRSRSKVSA